MTGEKPRNQQATGSWLILLWIVLALGLILSIISIIRAPWRLDGSLYFAIADSLASGAGLSAPWGYLGGDSFSSVAIGVTPVFTGYLAIWFAIFGDSLLVARIAQGALLLAAVGVTLLVGRHRFGIATGLIGASFVALSPMLMAQTSWGFGSYMVVLTVIGFLGAVLAAGRDLRWLALAGPIGALFLLTKGDGIPWYGALIWPIPWAVMLGLRHGRALLRSWWPWVGLGLFLLPMLGWHVYLWTQVDVATHDLGGQTDLIRLAITAFIKLGFTIVLVGAVLFFLWPMLATAVWRDWSWEQRFLAVFISLHIIALWARTTLQDPGPTFDPIWLFRSNHERYFVPFLVPLIWLILDQSESAEGGGAPQLEQSLLQRIGLTALIGGLVLPFVYLTMGFRYLVWVGSASLVPLFRSHRLHVILMLAPLVILSIDGASRTSGDPYINAVELIADDLSEGDIVAIPDSLEYQYDIYPYLQDSGATIARYSPNRSFSYVISDTPLDLSGYSLVGTAYWGTEFGWMILARDTLIDLVLSPIRNPPAEVPPDPILWVYAQTP